MSIGSKLIVPAIMASNISDFSNRLDITKNLLKHSLSKRIQIDIVDQSYGHSSITPEQIYANFSSIDRDFIIDWHLMVSDIDHCIKQIQGGNLLIIEYQPEIGLGQWQNYSQGISNLGIAFDVNVDPVQIEEFIFGSKHILVLANQAGVSGQKAFLSQTLERVRLLRSIYQDQEIGWDIGVNESNIRSIFASGVNVANVTSYLFNSSDPELSWDKLHQATL